MTPSAPDAPIEDRLRAALRDARLPFADAALEPMADKGLAHRHVRIVGAGLVARLPKQSQMALPAQANLDYQGACYRHAAPSAATPALFGLLAPSAALPRGGLLVEEIVGRAPRLPADLGAIVAALAALHALPLPRPRGRRPLLDAVDPLAALHAEIERQAVHLEAARLPGAARRRVDAERTALHGAVARRPRPSRRLIAFDAHPGNFLIRADGRAVLVDLEKARYSHPPLDLAHATLYTSTTWDVETCAELSVAEVADAYAAWRPAARLPASEPAWFVPLRAAMWLWSITWCAQWRVLSSRPAAASADGQDWSAQHSADALVAHVRDRVDRYLSAAGIDRVQRELDALRRTFGDATAA